jgi:transposase
VDLGPLPEDITVHLDAGYDSDKTRTELAAHGLHGRIAHKGEKAPIQASQRWHVERTHAWQNAFHRIARCYERRGGGHRHGPLRSGLSVPKTLSTSCDLGVFMDDAAETVAPPDLELI